MPSSSTLKLISFAFIAIIGLSCSGSDWIIDQKSGCSIFNPYPEPNETIAFDGECYQGKANGFGRLSWYSDSVLTSIYEGNFKDGKWEGNILVRYFDTPVLSYQGIYKESKREGPGFFEYSYGKRIECTFANGKLFGDAVITWRNGKRYLGELKDYEMDGRGSLFFPNGDRYDGEFKESKRNGRGIYVWSNGDRFEGIYQNDTRSSDGRLTFLQVNDSVESRSNPVEQPSVVQTGMCQRDSMLTIAKQLTDRLQPYLKYPPAAEKVRVVAIMRVKFTIDKNGLVTKCRFTTSNTNFPELFADVGNEIKNEILNTRFPITSEEGEPFEISTMLPLRFAMR